MSLSDISVTFLAGVTLLGNFTVCCMQTIAKDGEIIKIENALWSIVQKCENYLCYM